jgi:antitoxin (DNA-binding transcriptional repressor) of toxin-antitoxin stability system
METTILKAKNNLSQLLHKVESGEEVIIRRGVKGPMFRIIAHKEPMQRTLDPDPGWKKEIAYKEEDIWASEWNNEE